MPKKRQPRCCLCRSRFATLAMQCYWTNHAKPVDNKTVQVRARPMICDDCADTKLNRMPIIVDNYGQCRALLLEIANDPNRVREEILLFRSKKHQPKTQP